jgi:hypothetical protein
MNSISITGLRTPSDILLSRDHGSVTIQIRRAHVALARRVLGAGYEAVARAVKAERGSNAIRDLNALADTIQMQLLLADGDR